jgi:hypothetical protein
MKHLLILLASMTLFACGESADKADEAMDAVEDAVDSAIEATSG